MSAAREKSAVVLDRHPLWLDAMDKLLQGVGIEVVGRATEGDEAVALVLKHQPDMLVAGVDTDGSQLAALRKAKEAHPGLKSVVVSDGSDPAAIEAVFAAGASVYCVKTAEQEDLASAIRQAFERSIYMATTPIHSQAPQVSEAEATQAARDLTRRELEILRLVAEGHSNSQLARLLWVTEQTVKFHLSNIYRKLDVANRTEASRWAQLNGLLANRTESSPVLAAIA
jgi:NarL family two-component system response regulator LiaR